MASLFLIAVKRIKSSRETQTKQNTGNEKNKKRNVVPLQTHKNLTRRANCSIKLISIIPSANEQTLLSIGKLSRRRRSKGNSSENRLFLSYYFPFYRFSFARESASHYICIDTLQKLHLEVFFFEN